MPSSLSASRATPPSASWDEPEGLAARGTLIVLAGRGEHGGVYERFGRRLAFDAYRVRALGDPVADPSVLDEAAKLLADESLPGPKVLVGSDTGALYAARLAAEQTPGIDALILAGLPTAPGSPGVGRPRPRHAPPARPTRHASRTTRVSGAGHWTRPRTCRSRAWISYGFRCWPCTAPRTRSVHSPTRSAPTRGTPTYGP